MLCKQHVPLRGQLSFFMQQAYCLRSAVKTANANTNPLYTCFLNTYVKFLRSEINYYSDVYKTFC
jgi:hypothetical protein